MSSEYENDAECRSLFLHAKTALKKPYIIVSIGKNFDWKQSSMGFQIGAQEVNKSL